jgi:hypothetical protein
MTITEIAEAYESGQSVATIAKANGRSNDWVRRRLRLAGVKIRSNKEARAISVEPQDDNGAYMPSPEEIARATRAFRAQWPVDDKRLTAWTPPVVRDPEFCREEIDED